MSRAGALAVLPLALLPVVAAAQDHRDLESSGPLTLACDGVATNPLGEPARGRTTRQPAKAKGRSDNAGDRAADDGDTPPGPTTARPAGRGTPVTFRFEFATDGGRVLYPAAIVPVVHNGGRGGWWPVRDLAVSDDAFTGRVTLNFINHARFTIDRRSGLFNLTGLQANVTGHCARAEAGPRLF